MRCCDPLFLLLSRLFFTEFLSLVSRHIATIPPTERRKPGNVPEVPFGIGNKDFNDGLKESKYGYPILELYELVKPLTSTEMEAQWGVSIPMGFCYVKKGLWESIWGDDHGGDKVRKVFLTWAGRLQTFNASCKTCTIYGYLFEIRFVPLIFRF